MPTLSEAIDRVHRDLRDKLAAEAAQKADRHRARRRDVLEANLTNLYDALGVDQPAFGPTALVEFSTPDNITREDYVVVGVDGLVFGVTFNDIGPEYEILRLFVIRKCTKCDQPMAVRVGHPYAEGIAQAMMVEHHIDALECDEPFA